MKMTYLNEYYGIVTAVCNNHLVINLPHGGNIQAPKTEGIKVGNMVAFLIDAFQKKVTSVMLKDHADEIVKRGSNHLHDIADKYPQEEEENDSYTTETEWNDSTILWCPDLGQF